MCFFIKQHQYPCIPLKPTLLNLLNLLLSFCSCGYSIVSNKTTWVTRMKKQTSDDQTKSSTKWDWSWLVRLFDGVRTFVWDTKRCSTTRRHSDSFSERCLRLLLRKDSVQLPFCLSKTNEKRNRWSLGHLFLDFFHEDILVLLGTKQQTKRDSWLHQRRELWVCIFSSLGSMTCCGLLCEAIGHL